jgi:hypothetical protein
MGPIRVDENAGEGSRCVAYIGTLLERVQELSDLAIDRGQIVLPLIGRRRHRINGCLVTFVVNHENRHTAHLAITPLRHSLHPCVEILQDGDVLLDNE